MDTAFDKLFSVSQYVREIEPGFYTVLPETAAAPYDRKAAIYDIPHLFAAAQAEGGRP